LSVRVYRATAVYGSWYDGQQARGFEGHFVTSLSGEIGANRIKFAKVITPIFQKQIYQEHKIRVSPGQIRIRFEREQPALTRSRNVRAEFLEMTYRGRERHAERFPSQLFKWPKARRRPKIKKTRAARVRRRNKRKPSRRRMVKRRKRR
jgi:hypothetical protein